MGVFWSTVGVSDSWKVEGVFDGVGACSVVKKSAVVFVGEEEGGVCWGDVDTGEVV